MIARLLAALVRLADAFFPPAICAQCKEPIRQLVCNGDDRYAALWCNDRCQRSWEEA